MPVTFTQEEQAKVDEYLREQGYDQHAKEAIAKRNAEAQTHREAKEAEKKRADELEHQLKTYRDTEAKRKDDEAKRKADDEAKRKAEEDEKKSVQELIAGLEKKFEIELGKRDESAAKKQQEYLDEIKARDAQVLMLAVETEAKERGILDTELIKLLDVSKIPIDKGIVDREAVAKLIEEHAKSKPHLYKEMTEERGRDELGRFTRPAPGKKPTADVDASKLDASAFAELTERLRSQRE